MLSRKEDMKNLKNIYTIKESDLFNSEIFYFDDVLLRGKLKVVGGIYRIFLKENHGKILYVGKTANIKRRLYSSLLKGNISTHTLKRKLINKNLCTDQETANIYLKDSCVFQFLLEDNKKERSFLEHYFIAMLRPRLND